MEPDGDRAGGDEMGAGGVKSHGERGGKEGAGGVRAGIRGGMKRVQIGNGESIATLSG